MNPTRLLLHPTHEHWLKGGDSMAVRYDSILANTSPLGHFCTESTDTACSTCDLCRPQGNGGPPCYNFAFGGDIDVLPHEGFAQTAPEGAPTQINAAYISGCWPDRNGFFFQPEITGNYQLVGRSPRVVLAETRIRVLNDSSPTQTVLYPLKVYTEDHDGSTVTFYRWSIVADPPPADDPPWSDNFSPTLRVTKVRILQGKPTTDMNTGHLKLDEISITYPHPSRIVLISNFNNDPTVFGNDGNHCHANSSVDGDIDLRKCVLAHGLTCDTEGNCEDLVATPTFLGTPTSGMLTWFAEFKEDEGGRIPMLAADEVVAIEFTIERL